MRPLALILTVVFFRGVVPQTAQLQTRLQSSDLLKLRSVTAVQLSPDGARAAYVVTTTTDQAAPTVSSGVMTLADGKSVRFGVTRTRPANPHWSPDGQWIAYHGPRRREERPRDCAGRTAAARGCSRSGRHERPLPWQQHEPDLVARRQADRVRLGDAWPETADANGDPMVITRYLYKPDASEGHDPLQRQPAAAPLRRRRRDRRGQATDRRRPLRALDRLVAGRRRDRCSSRTASRTTISSSTTTSSRFSVADKSIRRLTATESAEYRPRWSPDGKTIAYQATKRGLTDLETTMEDTHVWLMNADGSNRRELAQPSTTGRARRSGPPTAALCYFTVQERGNVRLYRLPIATAAASREVVVSERGSVGRGRRSRTATIAYALHDAVAISRSSICRSARRAKLTDLNADAARRQADRRGRVVHVHQQRQQVRGRSVSHQAARSDRGLEASADREHPRRPARPAGPGVQLQEPGLRRARLGDADGELSRLDRLRPDVHRRRLRAIRTATRRQDVLYGVSAAHAALPVDRSRPARRRRRQLRRPAQRRG